MCQRACTQRSVRLEAVTLVRTLFTVVAALLVSASPALAAPPPRSCPAGTAAYAIHQVKSSPRELPGGRESSLFILASSLDAMIASYQARGYQFITYRDLWDQNYDPAAPCFLLSEDDGHLDFYLNGFPILVNRGVRATVFVNSSTANYVKDWINWEQHQDMINSGLIDVESHGALHEDFTTASNDRLRFLLTEGKRAIESRLYEFSNSPDPADWQPWQVRFVAYPRGLVDQRVVDLVAETGYSGGIALQPNGNWGWYSLARLYPR